MERTRLKFWASEDNEVIGFVSRNPKTKKMKGVREDSKFKKKVCVLSQDLKGKIETNKLYWVDLIPMNSGNGYVVINADPVKFEATIDSIIIPKSIYKLKCSFGNRTIYFDPLDGKTKSSKTLTGAINALRSKSEIDDMEAVIEKFKKEGFALLQRMQTDGYYIPKDINET